MQKQVQTVPEKIILSLALILANLRALMFIYLFPDTSVLWGPAWIEIMVWVFVAACVVYLLFRDKLFDTYFLSWRKN